MVDINVIRENPDLFKKAVIEKGIDLNIDVLLKTDSERREILSKVEDLRRQRNEAAREKNIEKGKKLKQDLDHLEEDLAKIDLKFQELIVKVPTIPSADTPRGKSDKDNVEIYCSKNLPKFDFDIKDHIQLGKNLGILDFDAGAKVSGYRGYYLKNEGVMLALGIMLYALNKLIEKGFKPMIPPTLVKGFALFGSGYFKGLDYNPETDEIYQVSSPDKELSGETTKGSKFLVGTAEPSLLAYYSGSTLPAAELPLKVCGFSPCYRSEIGSYGKETKGLYRVHEFMKVEMVIISPADIEQSDRLHQEMVNLSKEMHEELGLPYRVIQICTGDMSAGKYKAFDLEAWMPGLNRFGETGSASNFLDWQSRRLDIKCEDNKKYVYMLNNTALATPRTIIAILENFQQKDGSVKIPEVLQKYTGFSQILPKKKVN